MFSKQSLDRRKLYYHPRMILLVKRKQILWEGGALHLRGDEVFRKLVDKGHIFKSVTLEPPQNSVLLSWEEVLQWGSYSRSQDNVRHWCLNIKSKGYVSVHSGFHVPVMWPWLEDRVAFKGRKKNLSLFYKNSSVASTVNWIEEFKIRRKWRALSLWIGQGYGQQRWKKRNIEKALTQFKMTAYIGIDC